MTKMTFVLTLHDKLAGLPQNEVEERLNFYSEMIEDRIEDGLSEEEAVLQIGDIDEIAEQIISDISLIKITKEKIKSKRTYKAWESVLLILGSPIWLALLVCMIAIALALYISWWAIIISLWVAYVSFVASAFAGGVTGILYIFLKNVPAGFVMLGAGFVCIGISIFVFIGCKALTKLTFVLTKKIFIGIKKSFIKKENA